MVIDAVPSASVIFNSGLTILKEACLGSTEQPLLADLVLTHLSSREEIRLLDIGSGSGVVLRKLLRDLKARGMRTHATCVEPHPDGPWQLYETDGMDLVESRVEETSFDNRFDVVTCLQALYYLRSPFSAVERLASLVAAGGLMLITLWESSCALYRAARLLRDQTDGPLLSAEDIHRYARGRWGSAAVSYFGFSGPVAVHFLLQSPGALQAAAYVLARKPGTHVDEQHLAALRAHLLRGANILLRRNAIIALRPNVLRLPPVSP